MLDQPNARNLFIRGVVTRSGKHLEEGNDRSMRGPEGSLVSGGTETPQGTPPSGPRQGESVQVPNHGGTGSTGAAVGRAMPSPCPTPSSRPEDAYPVGEDPPRFVTIPKDVVSVWERAWGDMYLTCPTWKERWEKTQKLNEWPVGVKVFNGHMFLEEKWCVPLCFQDEVVQEIY